MILSSIANKLLELKVDAQSICLHSSLRSFQEVVSATEIIDAFLATDSTLMVPTMAWSVFSAPRPKSEHLIPFNAEEDGSIPVTKPKFGFATTSNLIGVAMGVLPKVMLESYPRIRGNHPLASFSAVGNSAKYLIEGQEPNSPFDPLKKLAKSNGNILLMGTTLRAVTMIHLAEDFVGLPRLYRWGLLANGRVIKCQVSGCSKGFEKFRPSLQKIEKTIEVKGSIWRLYSASSLLELSVDLLSKSPLAGICGDLNCNRCCTRRNYVTTL